VISAFVNKTLENWGKPTFPKTGALTRLDYPTEYKNFNVTYKNLDAAYKERHFAGAQTAGELAIVNLTSA